MVTISVRFSAASRGRRWICACLGGLFLGTSSPGQTPVLPANPESQFVLLRPNASYAGSAMVSVTGEAFTQAIRVETFLQPQNTWDIQLHLQNAAPIAQDDVLLATFYHRVIEPAGIGGFATFVFELGQSPWTKSAFQTVSVGTSDWQKTQIAFQSLEGYAIQQASINFQLGYAPQVIEIGGFEVVNFARTRTLEEVQDMIEYSVTYAGREPDAPWRTDAALRIDQHRKADLTVEVRDQWGHPMPGVPIDIHMRRHDFAFGSAVAASMLLDPSPDGEVYRGVVTQAFSRVVIENNLKWPTFESHRQRGIDAVNWLVDRGLEVRGHNILWPGWRWCPPDVEALAGDPAALRDRVNARIADVTTAFAGKLVDWDVINEPYSENDIMSVLGNREMISWFEQAKQGDAEATLYLNDYAILSASGTHSAHQNHFFDTIQFLLNTNAPIEGIGMQGHFQELLTPPETLYAVLERFKVFNLPIQVTEFDVDVASRELQADYLRDFYTMLFSHPSVDGILMWGFWEGRHWRPNAALYDLDWTLREHGAMWYDLVFAQWWTDAVGTSDATGRFSTRGFKGTYDIRATVHGQTRSRTIDLLEDGAFVLTVPRPAPWLSPTESGFDESDQLRLRVYKEESMSGIISVSPDLNVWTPVYTNPAPVSVFDFTDPDSVGKARRFYRAEGI